MSCKFSTSIIFKKRHDCNSKKANLNFFQLSSWQQSQFLVPFLKITKATPESGLQHGFFQQRQVRFNFLTKMEPSIFCQERILARILSWQTQFIIYEIQKKYDLTEYKKDFLDNMNFYENEIWMLSWRNISSKSGFPVFSDLFKNKPHKVFHFKRIDYY